MNENEKYEIIKKLTDTNGNKKAAASESRYFAMTFHVFTLRADMLKIH